jgi:transposase
MKPFVKAAASLRKHLTGITEALARKVNNGRHEGINTNVRLIIRRARGFHSAEAALGLVMLTCGPIAIGCRSWAGLISWGVSGFSRQTWGVWL